MCGIAGFLNLKLENAETQPLKQMADSLAHRGPDGEGFFTDRYAALSHRRLSIIDLSDNGRQPMTSACGRYTIVFNGEVYNFEELRAELTEKGASFKSGTDTEVVLWAWQIWGKECFSRFNGMWAAAIWDSQEEALLLCRDRLAVKPLYIYQNDEVFVFASEIKAIIASGFYTAKPNYAWMHQFLTSGYVTAGKNTFFEDVYMFPAATYRIYKKGRLAEEAEYWKLDTDAIKQKYDYSNPEAEFERLISKAVSRRLRSDTPVGTCLSGGLDSSALVGIATEQLNGGRIHSFTSAYPDDGYNEKFYAEKVVEKCNTEGYFVYPTAEEAMDFSVFGTHTFEAPVNGPTLISQLNVMRMANKHVKVLIDGQGGDELLGGYEYYYIYYLDELHRRVKNKTITKQQYKDVLKDLEGRPHLAQYLQRHKSHVFMENAKPLVNFGKKVLSLFGEDVPEKLERKLYASLEPELASPAFAKKMQNEPSLMPEENNPFSDLLNAQLYRSFFVYGIPNLLLLEDANAMAFSIEARTPYMDYEFVEFCFGLDINWKIKDGTTKYIQRQALDKYLPPEVKNRKDKMGYPTPYASWLRGPLKKPVEEILFSEKVKTRGILNTETISRLWSEHQNGSDWSEELYRMISCELWFRIFIDKSLEVPDMRTKSPLAKVDFMDGAKGAQVKE